MAEGQLLLWGETQVGKTTLLATGLLAEPDRLPSINWSASSAAVQENLLARWNRLKRNRLVDATVAPASFTLELRNGNTLGIRDIRGSMSREPAKEDYFARPGMAQGVLFVTEWEGADIAAHMVAIEAALPFCQEQCTGLAITKCERGLDTDDPHWHNPLGWWREHECWQPHASLLERFGERVWATTAYGFDVDGRPNCLLGEFGQILPYQIRPRNVWAPFGWFFKELGLW